MAETFTAHELAANCATVEYGGRRFGFLDEHDVTVVLMELDYDIVVTIHEDYEPELAWGWLDQDDADLREQWSQDEDMLFGVAWGPFGPIDADGREHVSLGYNVIKRYEDGNEVMLDSLWGLDALVSDPTLPGLDRAFDIDEVVSWADEYPEHTVRYQLADMLIEQGWADGREGL